MKSFMCLLIRWMLLVLMLPGFGLVASGTVHGGHTGNENVRDSVVLSLGDSAVIQVCIDSTVHLSCPLTIDPKNILSCKWTNNRTSEVYEAANIWVSPDTTTEYRLEVIYIESDKNLIRNGDFEDGNNLFYTEYKWASGTGTKALWPEGTYKIAQRGNQYHSNFDNLKDHTTGYGKMMVVNGDTVPNITVWKQEIGNVEADKQYAFSAWLATISEGTSPRFRFAINDEPLGNTFAPLHGEGWRQFYYIWTAKDNRALISLVDSVVEQNGNDFALDDISFAPVHRAVAKVEVSVLPRLVLNDLGSACEQDGFPAIVGSGMTDYEWKKLGTGWSSTERIPDISGLEGELPGRYSCYVKGYCGEIRDTFDILKQLEVSVVRDTVTVCSDKGKAQLGVVAQGSGITYEWRNEGEASTVLSRDSVYNISYSYWPAKWGTYICRVSSYCGTREVEVVFMKGEVRFLQVPRDTVICRGNEVCWVVKASMDAEVSWTLPDGSSWTGDTLRASAEGTYRYSVNGCNWGEVLTGEVRLGVHPFPGVLSFEQERDTLCEGESFSLSSGFSDRGLSYKWRHEGEVYGSDTCCISLGSVSVADTGWYVLRLTDVCGISQSDSVHLSLYPSLSLSSSFRDLSVCPGADVRLESSASGSGLSFVWDREGGFGDSYSLSGVSYSDSGYYHCRVRDVCGEVKTDTFHLQVLRLPEILHITPDVLSEEGSSHRIGVFAVGDSLSWSWSHDGVALSSQDSFLVFDALSYSDSGRYEVKVGNRCQTVTAHSDVRTFWQLLPSDQYEGLISICEGTDTLLSALVADTAQLRCRWYHDEVLVSGASGFDLSLNGVKGEDAGNYLCVVEGRGWSDSCRFALDVADSLRVLNAPVSQVVCEGSGVEFRSNASGRDVSYVWRAAGKDWHLRSDSILYKHAVTAEDTGLYVCRIGSRCGEVELSSRLSLEQELKLLDRPEDVVVCKGESVVWKVSANRSDARVRWWRPGVSVSAEGELLPELSLQHIIAGDAGVYHYRVESLCDTTEVFEVRLGVHPFPGVLGFERDRDTLCEGESFSLSSGFSDRGLSYEWRHEGVVYGSDTCCISLGSVSAADTGWYVLRLTDVCGISQSDSVHLSLYPSLSLSSSFRDLSVCPGADVRLEPSASGFGLSFLWDREGGFGDSYSLSGVSYSDSGYYHCRVRDVCGEVKTDTFHLQVLRLPEILHITPDVLSEEGSSHRIGVFAVGDSLSWSWSHDGVALSSQDSFLVFDALSYSDSGRYEVKVGNRCETVTAHSDVRTFWQLLPSDQYEGLISICEGTDTLLSALVADTAQLRCRWYHDEVLVSGASGFDLSLNGVKGEDAGNYLCVVEGRGWSDSCRFALDVADSLRVLNAPVSQVVCEGSGVEFRSNASGRDVSYVWRAAGEDWQLRSDSILYKHAVTAEDTGLYVCRIGSRCGEVELSSRLSLEQELKLLDRPEDVVVCEGESVAWKVSANRFDARVRWWRPGVSVSAEGELLPELSLQHIIAGDAGVYHYRVESLCDTTEVFEVRLGVHPFPGVLGFERDRDTLCEGESFSLSSGFSDRGLSYEWRHEGVVYGSDTCCISLGSVSAADTGWYVLRLTDVCGISQSDSVHLSLYPSLSLSSSFRDLSVCPGADVRLEPSVSGSGLSFVWDREGGFGDSYSLSGVSYSDSGYYHCRVTDVCGEVKTDTFHLQVLRLPEILHITPDVLSEEGSSHRIGVFAVGDSLSWSWSHDGVALSSQDSFLVFDALSYSDSGRYEVKVGNRCRVVTAHSNIRTYWVASLPDFLGNRVEKCEGTEVRLQVAVEDTTGLVCEWYREDSLMVGVHSFGLDFPALRKEDAAFYTCRIKGRGWSKEVEYKLEVLDSLRLETLPAELRVCEGETAEFRIDASGSGVTYEWLPAGEGWLGKADSVLFKDAVVVADSGRYVCRIGSLCGNKDVETGLSVEGEVRLMNMLRDTVVCTGDSLVWKVETNYGDAEVFWQLPDGSSRSGKSLTLINIQPEQAGIYRYQARGFCGKTVWKEVSLDVHPFLEPVHFASSLQSYCLYDSVSLISPVTARGLKYEWFKGKEAVSEKCIFGIGRMTVSDTGVYSLQVTDVCGLVQRDSIRLDLYHQLKIKSSELSRSVCEGDSVALEVRAEGKDVVYRWGNRGIKDSVMVLNPVALVDAGVYDCRVSSRCGDTVVSGRLRVNALPEIVLNLSPWAGSCVDSVVLSGSVPAGGVYRIKGKPVTVAYFEAEGNECEVSYYYRDPQTGCEAADSLRIRKAERPELVLQPDADIGACQSLSLEVLRASAGEIRWENALLDVSDRNHPVYTPPAGEEGEVKIAAVLTDIYGCEARDTVCIRVTALPEIEVSSDTVIGECNELKLEIRYDAERLGDIRWEPATGLEVGENYTAVLTDPAVGINVWTAVMTDRFGCEVRKPVKVTVVAAPREEWRESCEGEEVMADCRGYASCVWNDGRGDSVRVLTLPGEYKAVVTDRYGCQGEMSWSVHALPAFTLADTFIFEEQTIYFELADLKEPYGECRIVWWDGREDFRSEEVTTEGYYRVTVSDPIGCSFTDSLFLEVKKRGIKAPNAFLPNSEGENSRFYLKEVNFIGNFEMCIYDRWGELVYVTKEIGFNGGWNGTFKGTGCQPGAYMWVARNNGKIIGRGTVILVK